VDGWAEREGKEGWAEREGKRTEGIGLALL
jgi:hypothetical protein